MGPKQLRGTALRAEVGRTNGTSVRNWSIVQACNDGNLRARSTEKEEPANLLKRYSQRVLGIAFSPDGKLLAVGTNNEFTVFDAVTFKEKRTIKESGQLDVRISRLTSCPQFHDKLVLKQAYAIGSDAPRPSFFAGAVSAPRSVRSGFGWPSLVRQHASIPCLRGRSWR
jgi:WD40 repeat protein